MWKSLSCVWLFVTPRAAAHQTSLSITNSQSLTVKADTKKVKDWQVKVHGRLAGLGEPSRQRHSLLSIFCLLNWLEVNILPPHYWTFNCSINVLQWITISTTHNYMTAWVFFPPISHTHPVSGAQAHIKTGHVKSEENRVLWHSKSSSGVIPWER